MSSRAETMCMCAASREMPAMPCAWSRISRSGAPWVIAMLTESNNRALQVVPVRDREGTPIGLRCFRRCGLRWKMNLLLLLLLPYCWN